MTKEQLEQQLKHHWHGGRRSVLIECDEGWYPIISKLHSDICEIAPEHVILQIKEKLGGLRYYIDVLDKSKFDAVHDLLAKATNKSCQVCECCGNPGVLCRRRGWLKTLCNDCFIDWAEYSEHECEYGVKSND